ncbi:MAG: KEOPS complex subunit Pcc1 [Acidilobaceae archaeon]
MEEALKPDNTKLPPWLSIECKSIEDTLECTIRLDCSMPKRILSLRNTIEDLLISLRAVLESIREAESISS